MTQRGFGPEFGDSRAVPVTTRLNRVPWWALTAALLGVLFLWHITTNSTSQVIFDALREGILMTIFVTVVAYAFALVVALIVAFMRLSKNVFIYQVATFYVEIIRGVPILVLMLGLSFGVIPSVSRALFGDANLISQLGRVIIALVIAYSAFLSEIFRAGIESIERGQMEAARSLGMTYWQAMRYVILPQAIRNVLPPLGNDFIAMLKDSSLVAVLGVRDITGIGRLYAANTFRYIETYTIAAYLYLTMTLLLSMGVRWIERRMGESRQSG